MTLSMRSLKLFLVFSTLSLPLSAGWYSECPLCEQHLGGVSKVGPFATKSECQKWLATKLDNYPYRECYGSDDASASSGSSGDTSLQDSTNRALGYGLAHGDSEMFGLGLMGLGTQALLAGSQGPSPEQVEAQRRANQEAADRYQAEQAAKRRKFEAEKSEALGDLKGVDAKSSDLGLHGDGTDELKDAPNDDLKDIPTRPKKKWKPPRLKPVANPLHKEALPEDLTGGTVFNTREAAKAFAQANNGTIGKEDSGKFTWCPDGYPYSCSGHCYTEAAMNDFRIPCDSTLKTLRPED